MNFRIYIKKRLLDGTWSDPLCIQDSFMGIKEEMLVDPTLTKKKSSAGSFEAGVHFDNIALQTTDPKGQPWLEKGNTRIFIKAFKDKYDMPGLVTGISMRETPPELDYGQIIWDGRILSCDTDFYNQPKIHAEGSLSFLGDVLLPKMVFKCKTNDSQVDTDVYKYVDKPCDIFRIIIAAHNAKDTSHSDDVRNDYIESIRFVANTKADANGNTYGSIWPDSWVKEDTVEGGEGKQATTLSIGDETTQSALTKLLNAFGGGIRVTWKWTYDEEHAWEAKWVRYIEWITEDYDIQKEKDPSMVQFSANLLDMTRKTDASAIATCIMPRGFKAYSGGSWAVGDDMFAPVQEEWPRGSESEGKEKRMRTVSRVTWTSGCYIVKDNVAGAKYVWAPAPEGNPNGGGQQEQTMATGYLDAAGPYDAALVPGTYPIRFRQDQDDPVTDMTDPNARGSGSVKDDNGYYRGRALEVQFGEVYFISLEQSDSRVTYVTTAGPLGHNGSLVLDCQTASAGYWPSDPQARDFTKWDHHKVEIKRPTGQYKDLNGEVKRYDDVLPGCKIYLNISSRGWYFNWDPEHYTDLVDENDWKCWDGAPGDDSRFQGYHRGDDPYNHAPAGIWKGRKIPEGLDEYITLKGLGDGSYSTYFYNITVTTSDANGTTSTSKELVIDCPEQKQISRTEPGGVNGEFGYPYNDPLKRRGIVATVSDLPDPTTVATGAWYEVTAENNKKYVAVQTSTGVNRWYPQRTFVRDGYYVYDPEAVTQYGRIEKIVDMSDVHNPSYLEAAAAQTLYNAKFEAYSLDMSAIDAQLLTEDAQLSKVLDVMDPVYVRSAYHGVSVMLPIEELQLPFNDLGSMSYSLSFTTTQRITSNIATKKR